MTQWKHLPLSQGEYDPDEDILVRQSTIGQLQLCAKRVELADKAGYLEPVSEAMAYGTCLHYIIEKDMAAGEPRLDMLSNMDEWVEAVLVEQYDWTLAKVPNPRDFFGELAIGYRTWRKQVEPTLRGKPIGIEETMTLHLGEGRERSIWLQGTADLVYKTRLMDWKTSNSKWKQEKADVSIQASLYMALAKQTFGIEIKDFRFWTYYRKSREWTPFDTERKVREINAALLSAYEYGLQMEAGIYPATPVPESSFAKKRGWYCSAKFCGAWNICPAKYIADGKNTQEVAIRSW